MTKIKETIKRLEESKEHFLSMQKIDECTDCAKYIAAIDVAVEISEKQIPKKPNDNYCSVCKRHLRCPKTDIGYTGKVRNRKGDNYCPTCGQMIDWSDENGTRNFIQR